MTTRFLVSTIAAGMVCCISSQAADNAPAWDKTKAKARLDERTAFWFQNGKQLDTDPAGKIACLCCHTTVPYALARPTLRNALGESEPAPLARLLKDTARRVQSSETHELLYDDSAAKQAESRGTEAILSALILSSNDDSRGLRKPSAATLQALEHLWKLQRHNGDRPGGWDWLRFGLEPWESADAEYYGAVLAAYAIGSAPGYYGSDARLEPGVDLLRQYLKSRYANQNLHNRTWLLLASTRLPGLLSSQEKQDLVQEIKKRQKDGGWTLKNLMSASAAAAASKRKLAPETESPDGYATGLVVYALRKAGVSREDPNLQGGVTWLKKHQLPQGAWPAHSINKKRAEDDFAYWFMSDAGTAWAVMALVAAE